MSDEQLDLPQGTLDLLILRTIVGLDPEQTAAVLSISPGRVRLEQHAALKSLRVA